MSTSRVFACTALVGVLVGCPATPPPEEGSTGREEQNPQEETPEDGEGPFLSDTPLWTLEAPESLRLSCFGNSVALGDVNGDGTRDLVVAAPPCTGMKGRGSLVIYAGQGASFSSTPVIAELDWRNPNPAASGRNSEVSMGDVNGDRFADILVRSESAGTLVFAGGEDLGTVLQAPLFRVPFVGVHHAGFLDDLDGDGLDELVVAQGSAWKATVYRATPGAAAPFTQVRAFASSATWVAGVGDLDGDGAGEVLFGTTGGSQLYRGCKHEEPGVCEGGLSASPFWRSSAKVRGFFPDQNGDGFPEAVLGSAGRVEVHLVHPEGGVVPEPLWSILGDAAFPGFGHPLYFVGDLDADGAQREFLVGSAGRLYAFFPKQGLSTELHPGWAWPRSDALGQGFQGYVRYAPIRAGDLDGNGYPDLIAGLAPPYDQLTPATPARPGRVVALGGGKVSSRKPAPYLREAGACGLKAGGDGLPDMTVDADVLSRTVYVEQRSFSETACEVAERCVDAPGDRRLLRFSVAIPNLGTGAVRIPSPRERPDLYAFDACHQHDHLIGFASYRLLDAQGAVMTVGRKQGFFMVDVTPYCGDAGDPAVIVDETQGISPGWADVYAADYPCQWLDITGVPDGTYTLRVGVNENGLIEERDLWPDSAEVKVKLSGNAVEVLP